MRAKATVLPEGYTEPVEICVGVDTMSDVNLALRHLLSDVSPVLPDDVRGTGSMTTFDEQGFLDIFRDGDLQRIPLMLPLCPNFLPRAKPSSASLPSKISASFSTNRSCSKTPP